jgi:hypothetical protein
MSVPSPENRRLCLPKGNRAALRERLQQEMAQLRENIRARELTLAAVRVATMTRGRAALERTRRAAAPVRDNPRDGLVYKTHSNDPRAVDHSEPEQRPEWWGPMCDATGEALAETCIDMRAEFDATVMPLREEIAKLKGQISVLMTLFAADNNRPADPAQRLRLLKP